MTKEPSLSEGSFLLTCGCHLAGSVRSCQQIRPKKQDAQTWEEKAFMIAAIFDIEGTLFSGQMGRGFITYARQHGRWARAQFYFLSLMPKYLAYKLGWLPAQPLFEDAIRRMAWLIGGYNRKQAEEAYRWVAQDYILPSQHPAILKRWRDHQNQGHHTFIVSGGLEPCVAHIAHHLDADGFWGTKVEEHNGRLTGRILPPVTIGEDKRTGLEAMLKGKETKVDWPASYAYADSMHDLPVLEMVGHPVAVFPDEALAHVAANRGWEIIHQTDLPGGSVDHVSG
jgi:HAD superfamily hydrolase (TIGR01490 family)